MACCCCEGTNGVCCQGTNCTSVGSCECQQNGGTFQPNTTCTAAGACCLPGGACVEQSACGCAAAGGTYKGDCSSCAAAGLCGPGVPGTACGSQVTIEWSGFAEANGVPNQCLNGVYVFDPASQPAPFIGCFKRIQGCEYNSPLSGFMRGWVYAVVGFAAAPVPGNTSARRYSASFQTAIGFGDDDACGGPSGCDPAVGCYTRGRPADFASQLFSRDCETCQQFLSRISPTTFVLGDTGLSVTVSFS
jgi:hypothetical protein